MSFHRRRFVILDYSISETQFSIKISYFKPTFGHLIEKYTKEMINAIRTNKILRDSSWWNDTGFVRDGTDQGYFGDCIILTVNSY